LSSGDFSDPSIWEGNSVPGRNDDVVIKDGHIVYLTESARVKNITIEENSVLSLGESKIIIFCDLEVYGDVFPGYGRILFQGNSVSHNLVGNVYAHHLKVAGNSSSLIIQDTVSFSGKLTVNDNQVLINGLLILESTSESDAKIAEIGPNGGVVGNVMVLKYIYNDNRFWRYFSSPIDGATVADWQDDIPVTGGFENPTWGNTSQNSFYLYDETLSGEKNGGWTPYPQLVNSSEAPLIVGKGYSLFQRDNEDRPDHLGVTGNINQGDVQLPLTYTDNGSIDDDGWNLVGNPYPSSIDWDRIDESRIFNVDNAIYHNDNSTTPGTQVKRYYSNGVGIPEGTTGKISMCQSFWVKTNGDNPSIELNESDKVNKTAALYRKSKKNILRLIVEREYDNASDEVVVRLYDGATNYFDHNFDAYKKGGSDFSLATVSKDSSYLSINHVQLEADTVNISLLAGEGKYKFHFKGIKNFDKKVYLYDSVLGEMHDMSSGRYRFVVDSLQENRFKIVFEREVVARKGDKNEEADFTICPNPFINDITIYAEGIEGEYNIKLYSTDGELLMEADSTTDSFHIDLSDLKFGVYFVKVEYEDYSITKRIVKI